MSKTYPDLIYANFPDSLDPNRNFSDVDQSNWPLVEQFKTLYAQRNFTAIEQLFAQYPQLNDIVVNAKTLQTIYDIIIAIQRFYLDDVRDYLINIVTFRGVWDFSTQYHRYDMVIYNNIGYLCIEFDVPIGNLPTDANNWVKVTAQGPIGESGLGLTPRGVWTSIDRFYKDDWVVYDDATWFALVENINVTPGTNPSIWQQVNVLDTVGGGETWSTVTRVVQNIVYVDAKSNVTLDYIGVTTGTSAALVINNANFTVNDGVKCQIRLHATTAAGVRINVNGSGSLQILSSNGQALRAGAQAGSYMLIAFNSAQNVWYLLGGSTPDDVDIRYTGTLISGQTTVRGALDALFTYASNGRAVIAGVVGVASTYTHQQIAESINSSKATIAMNINGKGGSASSNDSLALLADKVGSSISVNANAYIDQFIGSSGSVTAPYGVYACDIHLYGGAAGGAGSGPSYTSGGGSGAFSTIVKGIAVSPGAVYGITIGGGGAANNTTNTTYPNPGGSSSFLGYTAAGSSDKGVTRQITPFNMGGVRYVCGVGTVVYMGVNHTLPQETGCGYLIDLYNDETWFHALPNSGSGGSGIFTSSQSSTNGGSGGCFIRWYRRNW